MWLENEKAWLFVTSQGLIWQSIKSIWMVSSGWVHQIRIWGFIFLKGYNLVLTVLWPAPGAPTLQKCVFTRYLLLALRGLFNLEITTNRSAAFFPQDSFYSFPIRVLRLSAAMRADPGRMRLLTCLLQWGLYKNGMDLIKTGRELEQRNKVVSTNLWNISSTIEGHKLSPEKVT